MFDFLLSLQCVTAVIRTCGLISELSDARLRLRHVDSLVVNDLMEM